MPVANHRFLIFFFFILVWVMPAFSTDQPIQNDSDYKAFLVILNLSDTGPRLREGDDSQSMLSRLATRELLTGLTPKMLYEKVAASLKVLEPQLKKLFALQRQINVGASQPAMKCLEVGLCVGFIWALGIRLSLGVIRTPRFTYPVFGFKFRFLTRSSSGDEPTFAIAVELGAETKANANTDSLSFVEHDRRAEDLDRSGAFVLGKYSSEISPQHSSKGLLVGFAYDTSYVNHAGIRMPIKIPIYRFNFEKKLDAILISMMRALQTFDFQGYAALLEKFKLEVEIVNRKIVERGFVPANEDNEGDVFLEAHPLASPGNLFHPQTLIRYSRDLAPEFLQIEGCDSALLPKNKKPPTLLLDG